MGSPQGAPGAAPDEFPPRNVTTDSFALGQFEVTFEEWSACHLDGDSEAANPGWSWVNQIMPVTWPLVLQRRRQRRPLRLLGGVCAVHVTSPRSVPTAAPARLKETERRTHGCAVPTGNQRHDDEKPVGVCSPRTGDTRL